MIRTDGTRIPAGGFLLLAAAVTAASLLATTMALADIYRYVDDEGSVCFTDAPVAGKAARVVIREREPRRQPRPGGVSARQKVVTAAAQKSVTLPPHDVGSVEEMPALPVQGVLTSPTGLRHDPIDGMLRLHQGVDIAIPEGTQVKPVAAGTVVFSGWRAGYGNTVVVQHNDGMTTLYAHNRLNLAKPGDTVGRETAIALSGSTGRSTGPHLHFEAWKDGTNLTESFIPADYPRQAVASASHRHLDGDGVRRILQSDGSILFTNLQ